MKADEKFSVVPKVTTPDYEAPLAFEYAAEGYSEKAVNNPCMSLYSADGEDWDSMGDDGDLCIKAYVTPERDGGGCDASGGGMAALAAVAFFAAESARRKRV